MTRIRSPTPGRAPKPPWYRRRRSEPGRRTGARSGPTILAVLAGGPLAGRRIKVEVVEGRPPKTIDVDADDGGTVSLRAL